MRIPPQNYKPFRLPLSELELLRQKKIKFGAKIFVRKRNVRTTRVCLIESLINLGAGAGRARELEEFIALKELDDLEKLKELGELGEPEDL